MSKKLLIAIACFLYANSVFSCIRSEVLEDISLPDQEILGVGHSLAMSIDNAISSLCSLDTLPTGLYSHARERLDDQYQLIDVLKSKGLLKDNQVRYYQKYLKGLKTNINACEIEALAMRRSGQAPQQEKRIAIAIKKNNLIKIAIHSHANGPIIRSIITHKIWFGRVLGQEGYDLCEVKRP